MNDETPPDDPIREAARLEKVGKITDSLNRDVLSTIETSPQRGGPLTVNYNQLLDMAKTMSTAKYGIPPHLQGNPGDCLAIRELALNTGLSAYGLAQHCYIVKGMLSYDAQVIHAIIEKHAPIEQRLRYTYDGSIGDGTRTCTVTGTFRGELDPVSYTTPQIGKITPKNSPLWTSDPDQQLGYFAVRRWGRKYCPDVLLGVFDRDEIDDNFVGADRAKDVTPNLMERLPGKIEGAGFATDVVDTSLAAKTTQKKAAVKKTVETAEKPKPQVSQREVQQTEETTTIPLPKNLKQYTAWVKQWIERSADADYINDRWKSERRMRNECGLVSEETAEIKQKHVDPKIKALSA